MHRSSVETGNSESATNTSFGSKGLGWVRSLRNIQLQVFLFQKSLLRPSWARTVLSSKTEPPKTQLTRVLGQKGWVGCVLCGKFKCKFFVPKVAITVLLGEFHTVLSSKTETPKTQQTRVLGQKGWIGCVCCGTFNCKFFVRKVAITVLPGEFRTVFPLKTETLKTQQT